MRSDAIAKPVHRVHKNIFQNSRRPWTTSPRSSPSSELRMVSLHKHTTKTVGCCVADLAMVKGGLREVGGSIPEGVTPLVPAIHVLLADRRLDAPHALSFVATCSVVQGKAGRKAERPSAQEGNEAGFLRRTEEKASREAQGGRRRGVEGSKRRRWRWRRYRLWGQGSERAGLDANRPELGPSQADADEGQGEWGSEGAAMRVFRSFD